MNANTLVLAAFAVTAAGTAVIWRLMVRASRRRQAGHARRVIAARNTVRAARGRPRDGRPLDEYEKAKFASVLLDLIASPDDDSADVREDQL